MPSDKYENLEPSTFEKIDAAVLEWVENVLNISATTNEGWKKVPVVWLTAERAFQIKHKQEMRSNDSQALVFPMITIEKTNVEKTNVGERPIPGNVYPINDRRRNSFYVSRKIKQDKTKNFANSTSQRLRGQINFPTPKNERIVYESKYIQMPVYYNMNYSINLRADYQQQMNEMMSPFAVYTGGINQFILEKDGYSYEAFIDASLSQENNISSLGEDEKKYETVVTIKVLGFIVGSEDNQVQPKIGIRENRVKIRFPRERVILGDVNENAVNDGDDKEPYRE